MRLRRNEYCPIHRSRFCCGRGQIRKERRLIRLGVQRIEDPQSLTGVSGIKVPGRDAQAAEPENRRAGQKVRDLP